MAQGHAKECPPGNPTPDGHSLAQGQQLEALCVFMLFLWSSHRVLCVFKQALCSVGSKILVNCYESNTISDFRNKIPPPAQWSSFVASPGMGSGSPHAPDMPCGSVFSSFPNSTLGLKVEKQRFGRNGGFSQPKSPGSLSWCKLLLYPWSFWESICHVREKKKAKQIINN